MLFLTEPAKLYFLITPLFIQQPHTVTLYLECLSGLVLVDRLLKKNSVKVFMLLYRDFWIVNVSRHLSVSITSNLSVLSCKLMHS